MNSFVEPIEVPPQPEPKRWSRLQVIGAGASIVLASVASLAIGGNQVSREHTYCAIVHASEVLDDSDAIQQLHDQLNSELDEVHYLHFSIGSVANALHKAKVNPGNGAEVCAKVHDNIIGRLKDRFLHTRRILAYPDPDPIYFQ